MFCHLFERPKPNFLLSRQLSSSGILTHPQFCWIEKDGDARLRVNGKRFAPTILSNSLTRSIAMNRMEAIDWLWSLCILLATKPD